MVTSFRFRKKRKHIPVKRCLFLLIVISLAITLFLNIELSPAITKLAERETETYFTTLLSRTVNEKMREIGCKYTDFIHITYKDDGTVSSLETDHISCNFVCTEIAVSALKNVSASEYRSVSIPAGNLTGLPMFSGKGPVCNVNLLLANGFSAHLESTFTEAGINQTIHRITIVMKIRVTLLVPGRETDFEIRHSFPLAETIILGAVPDAYTKIHRLTDDITETEIDDIYDFGAAAD